MQRVGLVIPCYNEQKRLQQDAFVALVDRHRDLDLWMVNDGSTDGTLEMIEKLERAHPGRIRAIDQQPNGGKAAAVRTGLLAAIGHGHAIVGFWDADLATPLDAIPELLAYLEQEPEVDVVIGSRVQLLGRRIRRRASRHYAGRVFATMASLLLEMPVYDTQCGAKFFRVNDTLRQALEAPFDTRWIFDVELFARMVDLRRFHGLPELGDAMVEHPLRVWEDVDGSKVRPKDFPLAFRDLVRIQLARRRGR